MKYFIGAILGGILLLNSCALVKSTSGSRLHSQANSYDAIIVPGFPYYDKSRNDILKMRILWAKQLYNSGQARHIVFTGSAVATHYNEAEVMKQIAVELGIPDSVIYTEKQAEHSTENIYYAMKICQQHDFKNVALATDFVQTAFLKSYTDKFFPYLAKLPIRFNEINMQSDISNIDVTNCQVDNFVSLKDRKSKQQINFASKGNNIDTSGYYIMNATFVASSIK